MWIARGLESFPPEVRGSVVALGTFDGVHLAHRAILAMAVERARTLGLTAVAFTFDPHPAEVLQPGRAPQPITTLEERLALVETTGVDGTVVLPFNQETAAIEPEVFVKEVLLGRLEAREIVVGYNHTFGRAARGNADLLRQLAERLGFQARIAPPYEVDGIPVSSSEIRSALQAGDVERAARFLGRPYFVAGRVVRGDGRGRSLGFPTANLEPERTPLVRTGVYACEVIVDREERQAVVNVGVRPTFGVNTLNVEAHVLDLEADLYGKQMRVDFIRRLRDEARFPSVDALRAQIAADVANARQR